MNRPLPPPEVVDAEIVSESIRQPGKVSAAARHEALLSASIEDVLKRIDDNLALGKQTSEAVLVQGLRDIARRLNAVEAALREHLDARPLGEVKRDRRAKRAKR